VQIHLSITGFFDDDVFFAGMCKELNERYPFLKNCLQFADNAGGNVKKNWDRIKESPVLFALDPVADLSLETVLCSLPRLCRLTSPDVETLEKRFTGETWYESGLVLCILIFCAFSPLSGPSVCVFV